MKFFGGMRRASGTNRLHFGGYADRDADPEIVYCLSQLISLSLSKTFLV